MSSTLATVTGATLATVQDGGRAGFANVGVPMSGAVHRERYLVATALLEGAPDERCPAIEILSGDVSFLTDRDVLLAVVGPARVDVDDQRAACGTTLLVPGGSRVRVSTEGRGPVYVVVDGWQPEIVLGSASTDTFSRLGGAILRPGYRLVGDALVNGRERIGTFHRALDEGSGPVRVVSTGHRGLRAFAATPWTVTAVARSGVRLAGGPMAAGGSVASAPMVPGAIQLTPGGEPIVLGPDGALTGGYPVVAVVATVDLDRLSLLSIADIVTFRAVEVDEAAAAWAARQRGLLRATAHPDQLP